MAAWKRTHPSPPPPMSTPYDTQWQASAYSLHEPQYDRYNTGYPPLPRTNEHGLPYDSNFLHPKPPHETIDGAALRGRTPSPTPSEKKELGKGAIDWKAMMNWRFWIRREWLCTSSKCGSQFQPLTKSSWRLVCR
jgi:hypothetical protein